MKSKHYLLFTTVILLFTGCSSSHKETVKEPPQQQPEIVFQDSSDFIETEAPPPPSPSTQGVPSWQPRFIATGSASGIMVEFTGLKPTAKLNARYAGIEILRIGQDSSATSLPITFNLTTTINDLRQAFFKVPPGTYLVRQTKVWAEQSNIQNVEVREGNYSVITIKVFNPSAQKIKQVSDTNDNK